MSSITQQRRGDASTTSVVRVSPRRAGSRRRSPHRWRMWERVGLGFVGVVVLAIVLEIASRSGLADPGYLPPLTEILGRFGRFFTEPNFYAQVGATLAGYLVGLGIAIVLGIALGVLFGLWEVTYRSSRTVI